MIINKSKPIEISALVKHIFDITLKRIPSETNLRTQVDFQLHFTHYFFMEPDNLMSSNQRTSTWVGHDLIIGKVMAQKASSFQGVSPREDCHLGTKYYDWVNSRNSPLQPISRLIESLEMSQVVKFPSLG